MGLAAPFRRELQNLRAVGASIIPGELLFEGQLTLIICLNSLVFEMDSVSLEHGECDGPQFFSAVSRSLLNYNLGSFDYALRLAGHSALHDRRLLRLPSRLRSVARRARVRFGLMPAQTLMDLSAGRL